MSEEINPEEIIMYPILPDVTDGISTADWIFDTIVIGVNVVFMLIWTAVCVVIWFAIGVPVFVFMFLVASFANFLHRISGKQKPQPSE